MASLVLGANFLLLASCMSTEALHPNTLNLSKDGLVPCSTSCGVASPSKAVVGVALLIMLEYAMASPHISSPILWWAIMALAELTRVLFLLSATPLCSGVLGAVLSCWIP